MRLALLICDIPIPSILAEEGDYTKIYSTWLNESQPGFEYVMDAFDVKSKMGYPPDDIHYDGFILTGSASSAYEDVQWVNKLIAYVARIPITRPEAKLFGICFGHQIVARAMGGECVPNGNRWEVGVTDVALTDLGQRIFGVTTLNIQEMHRDHVPAVPSGFQLLGSTSMSMNQGMVKFKSGSSDQPSSLSDIQILTVQGHPEYTRGIVKKITDVRASQGIIPLELAEDVEVRSNQRNDGVSILGKTFWEVLGISRDKVNSNIR